MVGSGRALLLAVALATTVATAAEGRVVAIVGAHIPSLEDGAVLADAVVLVEDGRIRSVGPAATTPVPPDADVVRLDGRFLVPGLMNMHVHLGLVLPGTAGAALAEESEAALALRMATNARAALLAGVTTIRLTGERAGADHALRAAIDRGDLEGPRIVTAGRQVSVTGGHGAGTTTGDGPYELRRLVRREIRAGARWIKIAISGGIATPGGDIAASHMTRDEIEAVVDIAHRHGVKVTAHSGSPAATMEAVELGVDCIEHGYFLTRDVLRRMREKGTWLVPTIVVSRPATMPFFERIGAPPWYLDRVRAVGERHWEALRTAIEEGVAVALGTDQLPHEPNDGTTATVREAEYYVQAGMTPLAALRAATIEPARLLGLDDELGSIEPGKWADLVATEENPAEDIAALRRILFVMKGGDIVRSDVP